MPPNQEGWVSWPFDENKKFVSKIICSVPTEFIISIGVRASSDSGRHDPCVRTCALAGGGRIHPGAHFCSEFVHVFTLS